MAGLRLKKLVIERFRNVRPGTTLSFSDGMNVLLGKNGTGKSTLLDAIVAMATGRPYAEEFAIESTLTLERRQIKLKLSRPADSSEPTYNKVRSPWAGTTAHLRFEGEPVEVVYANGRVELVVDGRQAAVEAVPLADTDSILPLLMSSLALAGGSGNLKLFGDQLGALLLTLFRRGRFLARYDETLGALGRMLVGVLDYPYALSELPEDVVARSSDVIRATPTTLPYVELGGEDVQFLRTAVEAYGFQEAKLSFRLLAAQGKSRTYGDPQFYFTAKDGSGFTESELSFGQKRLLSFLYYAACNPHIVVADELVNGLHYEWAKLCLDTISDRQAFLSSQDPLLFDYLTFESVEQVEQSLILCSLEKSEDGKGQFVWKNVPREEAEAFFRSYENGLQHVSEILKAKGLW